MATNKTFKLKVFIFILATLLILSLSVLFESKETPVLPLEMASPTPHYPNAVTLSMTPTASPPTVPANTAPATEPRKTTERLRSVLVNQPNPSLAPTPSAQTMTNVQTFQSRLKKYLKSLPKKSLQINQQEVWWLTQMTARSRDSQGTTPPASNLTTDDLLFLPSHLGPYGMIRLDQPSDTMALQSKGGFNDYPVVLMDDLNGNLGVLNGEISFSKMETATTEDFTGPYHLEFIQAYQGSLKNRVAFRMPKGTDIPKLLQKLESSGKIDLQFGIEVGITTHWISTH